MEHENSRPIVTIIVPVYNMKDYLEKSFDSIYSQTLTDWELYLVDDGSTDGSSTLCDILASDDSRIHVIHQENQGPAAARNAAIGLAKGKYLYFMDADDWAVPEMLYDMVCLAENYLLDAWAGKPVNNAGRRLSSIGRTLMNPSQMRADVPEEQCAQMVVTGFYIETYYSDEDYYLQRQAVRPRAFADQFSFREYAHLLFDNNLLYTPWNKLYLTSYIREHGITFPKMHWDDFPFNLDVIRDISRVTVTDKAYYHFIRKRSDSESEKYNPGLFDRREKENQWLLDLYRGWKGEYQNFLIEEMKRDPSLIPVFKEPEEQIEVKPSRKPMKEGADNPISGAAAAKNGMDAAKAEAGAGTGADAAKNGMDAAKAETGVGTNLKTVASEARIDSITDGKGSATAEGNSKVNSAVMSASSTNGAGSQTNANTGSTTGADKQTSTSASDFADNKASAHGTSQGNAQGVSQETSSYASGKQNLPAIPVPQVQIPSPQASEFIARRYLERIIGCIENLTNDDCALGKKEKRSEIKEMIHRESVQEALKTARPRSAYMKLMLVPLRLKSTGLTYLEGSIISGVKKKHVKLFAKLKADR